MRLTGSKFVLVVSTLSQHCYEQIRHICCGVEGVHKRHYSYTSNTCRVVSISKSLPRCCCCTARVVFGRLAFGQDPNDGAEYMPHVSLLYGDLPTATREDVRQAAEPGLRDSDVELDCIEVWCTQGIVTEWKLLGSFPLQQQQQQPS